MFSWFVEKLKQPKQLEKASMAYCWWAANKNDGRGADGLGATIFRSTYYILNNVVNLVKGGVFILLVVISSFKKNSGHYMLLWFETILNKEFVNY
jgi:hypothetical protein